MDDDRLNQVPAGTKKAEDVDVEAGDKDDRKTDSSTDENDDSAFEKARRRLSPTLKSSSIFFYGVLFGSFLVGCVTVNDCPVNRLIPVYLIVTGVAGALTHLLIRTRNPHAFNLLLALIVFDVAWHGLGSFWVYVEYQPNYDSQNGRPHCSRLAFLLAFWLLTIQTTLVILCLLLVTCYLLMRDDFRN